MNERTKTKWRFAKIKLVAITLYLAAALLFGPMACAPSQIRPGVTQVRGAYQRYFKTTPKQAILAAEKVYAELGLLVAQQTDFQITGRTSQGSVVETWAEADGGLVLVRCRVEPGYDETLSLAILDRVADQAATEGLLPLPREGSD